MDTKVNGNTNRRVRLPEGVIRLSNLTHDVIMNNDVTCIVNKGKNNDTLQLNESWAELMKVELCLLYIKNPDKFMKRIYDSKIIDNDFHIYRESIGENMGNNFVYAEKIPGAPYYINCNCYGKGISEKLKSLAKLLEFDTKDILLTLRPIASAKQVDA